MPNEELTLLPFDLKWVKGNFDADAFGDFDLHFNKFYVDTKLSKMLYVNGKVIGYVMVKPLSMGRIIKDILYWVKHKKYSDFSLFVSPDSIRSYSKKQGIFINSIYIMPQYRHQSYSDKLTEYCRQLGDYTWGISRKIIFEKYWGPKQHQIRTVEYNDGEEVNVIFADQR